MREATVQDDRGSNVGGEPPASATPGDHAGERRTGLSARSLAARGDAPDGSEDVPARAEEGEDEDAGA